MCRNLFLNCYMCADITSFIFASWPKIFTIWPIREKVANL